MTYIHTSDPFRFRVRGHLPKFRGNPEGCLVNKHEFEPSNGHQQEDYIPIMIHGTGIFTHNLA